jgi:hypothetical protein
MKAPQLPPSALAALRFALILSVFIGAGREALSASSAVSDPPRLSIEYRQGEFIIGWPVGDWVLENSPYLTYPVLWRSVPLTAAETNGTNISLAIPYSDRNLFFRLRRPNSDNESAWGLTGQWTFEEGQGQLAEDSSSMGHTAALSDVAWTGGRIGSHALWFNGGEADAGGSRAWVSNGNYRVLPPEQRPFSVSLWFNPDALTTGWRGLIGNNADGSSGWYLALHTTGPGTNEVVFASTGSGGLNVSGRKLLLPGLWYELTATYDGSEGRIYLESELLGHGNGTVSANDQPIYFGGGLNHFDSFLGAIDEVRLYTNALTHQDISLAGQWHMDENGGTLVADSSLHRRHGILSNSTAWAQGKVRSGLDLSDSLVVIRNDSLDLLPPTGKPFSLSFWLYPESLSAGWQGLMGCGNSGIAGWRLAVNGGNPEQSRIRFWSTDSGGTLDLSAPLVLSERTWTKLDLTYNGGIATLYANGRKIGSGSGGIQGSAAPLLLGSVPETINFHGVVDELQIYRRERSESEIGPVAQAMWETVLVNTATNLVLQGSGPPGKSLTYALMPIVSPTNGTVTVADGTPVATYTGGSNKGPDAFAYTVSDGEFTSLPAIVVMSVVEPHWLSPSGGPVPPLDGSSPEHAWSADSAVALDAIWKTNRYYDCFFYAPGEYQTRGWHSYHRSTANPGCKHIGSGSEGLQATTIKLVETWEAWNEGAIFGPGGAMCDNFEARDMRLDCNAANNPKYAIGEPVWIAIPLVGTSRVDSITLRWDDSVFNGVWRFGRAERFSICTRVPGTMGSITNGNLSSAGPVDIVPIGTITDEVLIRLERRASGVNFYGLSEIEVTGATISLPTATIPAGGQSELDPSSKKYSILHVLDGNDRTVWASGPEDQVRIALPLGSGTAVSRVSLSWYCKIIDGVGRLGPAVDYQIQVRNATTGGYDNIPFTRQQRTPEGLDVNDFTEVVTDELVIVLNARELGVDFYSLREISLSGGGLVRPKVPNSLNSLMWGDYQILRAFDRSPLTQWASDTQGSCVAIRALGSNLRFTRLKIIGFGTKATRECFPIGIETSLGGSRLNFGNVLVEDCVLTEPATNNTDGLTGVLMVGAPPRLLTNAVVRRCSVTGVLSQFLPRYSQAFSAIQVENCLVSDCLTAVYFEPNPSWGDSLGPVLIRSNQFINVENGIRLAFAAGAQFDSLTCLENEIVLRGAGGWAFVACDTCSQGPSGSTTNVTVLNNVVRYADWSPRLSSPDSGLYCSDIHNSVFGNNVVVLSTANALRLRPCPSGIIPPPRPSERCDEVIISEPPGSTYPRCLDVLPAGYRRVWFNNRDLAGNLLNVRYWNNNVDGFASQQQWP